MNEGHTILLIDDSENDLLLTRMAFEKAGLRNSLQTAHNGEEAISYFQGEGKFSDRTLYPLPAVVLLDLNMPRKNGFDFLRWVGTRPDFHRIPIVVLTASMRSEDVQRAYELDAAAFLVKPASMEDLIGMIQCLRDWLQINHFPPQNELVRR